MNTLYVYLGIIFILHVLIIFLFFVNKFKLLGFKNYEIRNIYSRIIVIIKKTMNFKERGITVGDLLIVTFIVIITSIAINKFKENKQQTYLNGFHKQIIDYEIKT